MTSTSGRYRVTGGAVAVTAGVPFTLRVLGTFLREDDRYRVVTDAVSCGGAGAATNAPGLAGDLVDDLQTPGTAVTESARACSYDSS